MNSGSGGTTRQRRRRRRRRAKVETANNEAAAGPPTPPVPRRATLIAPAGNRTDEVATAARAAGLDVVERTNAPADDDDDGGDVVLYLPDPARPAAAADELAALAAARHRPVVVIAGDWIDVHAPALAAAGVAALVTWPASPSALSAHVQIACRQSAELAVARREAQLARQTLDTRRLVDRAKAVYMRRLHLDEPAAHRRLQQESQNRRLNLAELARQVIAADAGAER